MDATNIIAESLIGWFKTQEIANDPHLWVKVDLLCASGPSVEVDGSFPVNELAQAISRAVQTMDEESNKNARIERYESWLDSVLSDPDSAQKPARVPTQPLILGD